MTTNTLTPQHILDTAADILITDGWTQGNYRDVGGCRCALGALGAAAECDPTYSRTAAFDDAERHLLETIGATNVIDWNDADDRTAPDVIAAMRKAANLATAKQAATNDAAA